MTSYYHQQIEYIQEISYKHQVSRTSNGLTESKFFLQLLKGSLYFRNTIVKVVCCCLAILSIFCLPSKLCVWIISSVILGAGVINLQFIFQKFHEFLTNCLIEQNAIDGLHDISPKVQLVAAELSILNNYMVILNNNSYNNRLWNKANLLLILPRGF